MPKKKPRGRPAMYDGEIMLRISLRIRAIEKGKLDAMAKKERATFLRRVIANALND